MDGDARINPYLTGNFAPVRSEDDFDLPVVGEIPRELRGALFRIGPNPQFEPRDPNHHWFSGDGMVHGFYVEDGKVRYRNRYVRTPKWQAENAAGRSLFGSFGNPMTTDPSALGQDSGVANTNIVWHAGRLMALEEGHMPTQMDPGTLETIGYAEAYRGRTTAHPKLDPVSGEMVWFAYGVGDMPLSAGMSYGVTGADGKVVRRDDFQAPFACMVHDFMVTQNHVLFPILPLTASLERAMSGKPAFAWEPEKGAYVGVMRRDGDVGSIRWFNTEACYVFHPLNAWEEEGRIVADVMRYDAAPLFPNADGSPGRKTAARLVRWTFDLAGNSDAIKEEPLDDLDGEFPRVDPRVETLRHRHGWYAADPTNGKTIKQGAIAHLDLTTGARQVYALPDGDLTSEPVFTPRSADAPEGDGWVTAVVWRAAENRSDLLVFEAQDIARGPVATAAMPRRVPFGFHGNWVSL
ncbi:retinal pigment epithelial membrane protein [Phenylobacterium zucineum HLK1]|uniref:Dioxygenase n=1 Tax=Phenylobacterium zucineum (strain HLK1) TaxID=450851 RepID=B4RG44_PHEZH|nr:carotenoid oxygenase family protein [Phenylobacterium zucineum]ACG77168.1 retinal pigment epithelial membrane protein [Phenylobacterium zucineum HLK1]